MNRPILPVVLGTALIAGACQPQPHTESRARGSGVPEALETFDAPGIRLSHPAGWHRTSSEDREMYLEVIGTPPSPPSYAMLSLDIPKLPPHVPGFIPLGLVVNGYVDDLKKRLAGIEVGKPVELKVAGANARRVRSQWDANGATHVEDAVLTVHGDRVYIFRANVEAADEPAARDALEQLLASVKWE